MKAYIVKKNVLVHDWAPHPVSRFSYTWFIYNLNTMFIRCKYTCLQYTYTYKHFHESCSFTDPPFASPFVHFQPFVQVSHPFYLHGDPSFYDRGANIHPLSSLVSDQLFTLCFLTPPRDTPRFMLHVNRDDISNIVWYMYNMTDCRGSNTTNHFNHCHNLNMVRKNQKIF
jgi:hypothetical protein